MDMQPTASANGSALTAAAAARLLASAAEPFALSLADVKARLLHPTLLDQVGRMLYLDSVSQGLSEEDMLNLQTAVVDESVSSSHPWMASDAQPDACVEDDILDVRDVLARVQGSINTFEDGPPKVHVAIVRDNSEYFAIAWQLSLQHNGPPCAVTAESRLPRPLPRRQARARVLHTKMPFEPPGEDFSHPCYVRARRLCSPHKICPKWCMSMAVFNLNT